MLSATNKPFMLSVLVLNVFMLSNIVLSVIILVWKYQPGVSKTNGKAYNNTVTLEFVVFQCLGIISDFTVVQVTSLCLLKQYLQW